MKEEREYRMHRRRQHTCSVSCNYSIDSKQTTLWTTHRMSVSASYDVQVDGGLLPLAKCAFLLKCTVLCGISPMTFPPTYPPLSEKSLSP